MVGASPQNLFGITPTQSRLLYKAHKGIISLLYKSPSSLDLQTRKPLGLSKFLSLPNFSKKNPLNL